MCTTSGQKAIDISHSIQIHKKTNGPGQLNDSFLALDWYGEHHLTHPCSAAVVGQRQQQESRLYFTQGFGTAERSWLHPNIFYLFQIWHFEESHSVRHWKRSVMGSRYTINTTMCMLWSLIYFCYKENTTVFHKSRGGESIGLCPS